MVQFEIILTIIFVNLFVINRGFKLLDLPRQNSVPIIHKQSLRTLQRRQLKLKYHFVCSVVCLLFWNII